MAQLSQGISKGLVKGLFGAMVLSLTFGAVASGRDLGLQGASSPLSLADASAASINRAAKTDLAVHPTPRAIQTQTLSLRLNDLANTSVLIRVPVARAAGNGTPASSLAKSGAAKAPVACEPVVSVLTEIAKRLQPGRCVT